MAMVTQASSPGLSSRPPRAPKLSALSVRTLITCYLGGCCAHPIPVRHKTKRMTPISRRKSVTEKLDMDLVQEDLRRDDEERLEELIENLASWLTQLLGLPVTTDTFLPTLRDGVVLCTVANKIQLAAVRYRTKHPDSGLSIPSKGIHKFHKNCAPSSFHARENITKFVMWADQFGVGEALLFNSDELILGNGKKVALCLQAIARKTKLFIPTLDFEISKMVAVLRDLGTLLGANLMKGKPDQRDKILDAVISERGFWRGIQQRISDAIKSENSVKRDVNQQDIQMLRLLGVGQAGKNKMENTIEEAKREDMIRILQAAAKTRDSHTTYQQQLLEVETPSESDFDHLELDSSISEEMSEDYKVVEIKQRIRPCFVRVKVPSSSAPKQELLSPEMFFYGANKPSYEELSLDMFMQGYTALIADDRVSDDEKLGRLRLIQLVFTYVVRHSWYAIRHSHKQLLDMIQLGEVKWADDLDKPFEQLLNDWLRESSSSSVSRCSSSSACCSSCGGKTPLRAKRTTPLTVRRVMRNSSTGSFSDYEVELPSHNINRKLPLIVQRKSVN